MTAQLEDATDCDALYGEPPVSADRLQAATGAEEHVSSPRPSSPRPDITILGAMSLRRDNDIVLVPGRLDRAVLAHLVLADGRGISVDLLIDALWGENPPRQARNALQVKVSRLRSLLGPNSECLTYRQGRYLLDIGDDKVDIRLFSTLVGRASAQVHSGQFDDARASIERALQLWGGELLADLDDHPRLVAARLRLLDEWATAHELLADIELAVNAVLTQTMARLRGVLDTDPLRPRARLLLMRALERSGRRAEALEVYDVGRRELAEATGLAPTAELQDAFNSLLEAERSAKRRATVGLERAAPIGSMDTARWLLAEGDLSGATNLALRGAWWWWLCGSRTEGRDLFEDLIEVHAASHVDDDGLKLTAWRSVFRSVEADAEQAIADGERSIFSIRTRWTRYEALAALLLSERLLQRGHHDRGQSLLSAARAHFETKNDEWGTALAGLVEAKGLLLGGNVRVAGQRADGLLRRFDELEDIAGQIMALDLAGYAAEVVGDFAAATTIHRRALDLARRAQAPEWEATQLTRLGSVLALRGVHDGLALLHEAVETAQSINSHASLALAKNGVGLAAGIAGDHVTSIEAHKFTLGWYQRQGSPAGVSYSAGRLAHALKDEDPSTAATLAGQAVRVAIQTADPRAVAHGLEAAACVVPDPRERARSLGASRAIRKATSAPLPPVLAMPLNRSELALQQRLGNEFVTELRRGARESQRHLPPNLRSKRTPS